MVPATPTPLAAVSSIPVSLDYTKFRIWAFADDAVMIWQQMQKHNMGTVIQIAVILIMVIFFVVYVTRLAQGLTNEGEL